MAELLLQDRLQPALLDRLTDEEPLKTQEPREQRVISKSTTASGGAARPRLAAERQPARACRRVPRRAARAPLGDQLRSAGLLRARPPPRSSRSDLERAIAAAIRDFEPRILPHTLEVRAIISENQHEKHNIIGAEIHGQLWSQPVPLEMLVRTEIDLETGEVDIADVGVARVA